MAGRIFINYRRSDSISTAGRLHDRLAQTFGRKNLFMDVDHIPAGVDFAAYLNKQVAACDVFLAVIGPNWLDAKGGLRPLDNPDDFVAIEIAAALARDIRVIPVLVDGASMPKADDLPEPLKPLARRNAVDVRNTQFGRDADALIEKVRAALKGERGRPMRRPVVAAAAIALLLAGGIGLYQIGIPGVTSRSPVNAPPRTPVAETNRPADRQALTTRPAAGSFIPMAGALEESRWQNARPGSSQFIEGALHVLTYGGAELIIARDTMIEKDFTYSIRTELVSGSTGLGFGLVFGMEDFDNYFLFAKRTAGEYRLAQKRGGREQVVVPWTKSNLITPVLREQMLRVVSEGPFVTLFADGQKLQQVRLDREPAGSVGLFADSPGLSVKFSDVAFGARR